MASYLARATDTNSLIRRFFLANSILKLFLSTDYCDVGNESLLVKWTQDETAVDNNNTVNIRLESQMTPTSRDKRKTSHSTSTHNRKLNGSKSKQHTARALSEEMDGKTPPPPPPLRHTMEMQEGWKLNACANAGQFYCYTLVQCRTWHSRMQYCLTTHHSHTHTHESVAVDIEHRHGPQQEVKTHYVHSSHLCWCWLKVVQQLTPHVSLCGNCSRFYGYRIASSEHARCTSMCLCIMH